MSKFKFDLIEPKKKDSVIETFGKLVGHKVSGGNNLRIVGAATFDAMNGLLKDFYGNLRSGIRVGREGSEDCMDYDSEGNKRNYRCFSLVWSDKNGKPVESKKLYVLYNGFSYSLREKTDYVRRRLAKLKQYQVIGGQYEQFWYGQSDSLRGAKIIANRNNELWDNWQGWHTPAIYRAEDCMLRECNGMLTKRDGVRMVVHNPDARPVVTNRGVELDDGYGY